RVRAVSPSGWSGKKEGFHGDRDILLSGRIVGGAIRRVHQIIEEGWGGQPGWTFVPCGVWPERQTDGVRCLDIAGGVRQVREDADAYPSTTRDRSGTADCGAGAQGDRAGGEGRVAQEAGEGLCSAAEALTIRDHRARGVPGLSVPLLKGVRIPPRIAND